MALRCLGVVAQTAALLALLLVWHPFGALNRALDWLFGVPPEASRIIPVRKNADLHETSFGENPLASFRHLEQVWARKPGARRVVFVGNSQMQMVTLAGNEPASPEPEPTYFDWVAEHWTAQGKPLVSYRLSAGALSYAEALWNLLYMAGTPGVKPDAVVLQANYQGFWNAGIRDGMFGLLDDPAFHARVSASAEPGSSLFAEMFAQALAKHGELAAKSGVANGAGAVGSAAAAHAALPAGYRIETAARTRLEQGWPRFARRDEHKVDLLNTLYRGRIYLLGLRASSARSITGTRLERSRACLEAIASLCRREGIRLMVFTAPVNPNVSLFKTAADRDNYRGYLERFSATWKVPLFDFESAIPAPLWGRLLDGPDPLHLGREGHKRLAALLEQNLAAQGF